MSKFRPTWPRFSIHPRREPLQCGQPEYRGGPALTTPSVAEQTEGLTIPRLLHRNAAETIPQLEDLLGVKLGR